jgi:nucleoside-diphosphate-sugar epimerase
MAYHRAHDVPVKIVRIFNTYGPRLRRRGGRAVPTFIEQARNHEPFTVYGDGSRTRSLCYVDDMVEGIWRLLASDVVGMPVNLGNPEEVKVLDLGGRSGASSEAMPTWSSSTGRPTTPRSALPTSPAHGHCTGGSRPSRSATGWPV